MTKRRYVMRFTRASKTSSEAESSEVGSDEECEPLSASEDVLMDIDGPPVDGGWQNFEEGDRSGKTVVEGTPSLNTIESDIIVEEYPGAAIIIGRGQNLYSRIIATDEHREKRKIAGPFYPFSGQEDWEMYKWLSSIRGPMEKLDEFFKLPYVYFFLLLSTIFCLFFCR